MEETLTALKDVRFVLNTAIVLIEHPGDGETKKKTVIGIVKEFIKSNHIVIPVPNAILEYILGFAVDWIVNWLNNNIWKKDEQK